MNNTSPLVLQYAGVKAAYFKRGSRYFGLGTNVTEHNGAPIAFVRRRFIPPSDRLVTVQEHTASQGERPDTIANEHLGDPEQFWRICDANDVMHPNELTQIGRIVRITLPEVTIGI